MKAYEVVTTLKVRKVTVVHANSSKEAAKAVKSGQGVTTTQQVANTVGSVKQYNY